MLHGNRQARPMAEPAKVILKKYGKNRRLYDTSSSRYVNLEELAALIRKGTEVQVLDAQTGEDLTRTCLMQIVMEEAKERPTALPLELLRQLILASDHVGREFIMWYLQSAFDTYHKVQNALESGLTEVHSAASSPLQMVKNFIQGTAAQNAPAENELQQLRTRVAELEARLEKSHKRPPKRRKSASSTAG